MATRSPSHMSGYSGVSYPASLAYSLGQPIIAKTYSFVPPNKNFVNACIIAFVGMILFIMSFSSPYWLVSYEYTYNPFKNMGLWEFCFEDYRYPKYQFDHKFTGCNYIFSNEYRIIWEWMLPVWFMATQTFMSLALIATLACTATAACVLIRYPMQSVLRYEWHMIGFCALCMGATVFCLFFAVLVFGLKCWSRDWLQNPNFNYLGWSYFFSVFAGGFFGLAGLMMLYEMYAARDRKREVNNLLHMEPQNGQMEHHHSEIPSDSQQFQTYPPGHGPYTAAAGSNPAYSREQSVYSQSQASAYSQNMAYPSYM